MSLVNEQFEFAKDVVKLFNFIIDLGYVFSIGEVFRTKEQQDYYVKTGKSKTYDSYHLKKTAIDINIFIAGNLTYDKIILQTIGDYWEKLNPKNKWGGNFETFIDTPHFERRV